MAKTMKCNVVSAERELYSGDVEMVIASGELGDLGVTPGHSPLITTLKPGPVRLVFGDRDDELFYVSGGFLEVMPSGVNILTDTGDRAENLDEAAAVHAKAEAQRLLEEQNADFDYTRAAVELAEAVARLRVIEQLRNRRA